MQSYSRRRFLASSLGGAAALSLGPAFFAQEKAAKQAKAAPAPLPVSSDPLASLFLTWQQEPTTTMTIQWVGSESAADIRFAPLNDGAWRTARANAKPYTNTELIVHRCELTGLTPGTEYKFQIGKDEKDLRFRTMPTKAT